MVIRTPDNIHNETARYQKRMQFGEGDRFITMAPFYHSYAFFCILLMCRQTGASLVLPDIILPRRLMELTNTLNVNCVYAIPYFFEKMLDVQTIPELTPDIRYVMSTAQRVPAELAENFRRRFGLSIRQQYGSTEAGCVAEGDVLSGAGYMEPVEGVSFFTEQNAAGQNVLRIRTEETIGQYVYSDHVETISRNGVYATHDVAEIAADGSVRILGREDRVIIRTGEKLDAAYVEGILTQYPGLDRAALSLNDRNELICEYASADDSELNLPKLREYCGKYLLDFQIPERFIHTPALLRKAKNWKGQ